MLKYFFILFYLIILTSQQYYYGRNNRYLSNYQQYPSEHYSSPSLNVPQYSHNINPFEEYYTPMNTYSQQQQQPISQHHHNRPRSRTNRRRKHRPQPSFTSRGSFDVEESRQQVSRRSNRRHYTPPLIHIADPQQVAVHRLDTPIYFKKVNTFGKDVPGQYVRPGPGQIPYPR